MTLLGWAGVWLGLWTIGMLIIQQPDSISRVFGASIVATLLTLSAWMIVEGMHG